MRKIARRPIVLEPGIRTMSYDVSSGRGSRIENLPPFDEYNPKRVHIARRRQATKDHHSFPRGWSIDFGTNDFTVTTVTKK